MTDSYRFSGNEVRADQRQLLIDGNTAAVGARAFDLLVALIERRDRIVDKSELFDIVWPGLVVEENNLHVQVSSLRKLLGPNAIATIPGRGYQFVATLAADGANYVSATEDEHAPNNLPLARTRFIGREKALQDCRWLEAAPAGR
jgi:DNA-binding winged helix-turn-helix (wHTH) protein